VAGGVVPLAGAEGGVEVVGELDRDVEERALAGGPVVGDGGLDEVAGAVHLVLDGHIGPALVEAGEREVAVEVPIGALGRGDGGDEFVDGAFEGGVVL
jgi:hypothetical protein